MSRNRLAIPLLIFCAGLGCAEKKDVGGTKDVSVSDMYPKRGPYIGGDPVIIKGSGFTPSQGITIYFGRKKARPPIIKENGEITVEPPAGEAGQTVDVEIEFADSRRLTLPKAYTYYDPAAKKPDGGQ